MGLLDVLDELDLSDDVKDKIRREHSTEVGAKDEELSSLRAKSKEETVDTEVEGLKGLFGEECPGLLAYYRRVMLSDDEQPGAVLLSDGDMGLSGDKATGATSREEVSVAGALREFVKLMPRNQEGELAIKLSDQALAGNAGDPPPVDDNDGDDDDGARRQRVEGVLGRPIKRSRRRYRQGGLVVAGADGGDA